MGEDRDLYHRGSGGIYCNSIGIQEGNGVMWDSPNAICTIPIQVYEIE